MEIVDFSECGLLKVVEIEEDEGELSKCSQAR